MEAASQRLEPDELEALDGLVEWGIADDILPPEVSPSPGIRDRGPAAGQRKLPISVLMRGSG